MKILFISNQISNSDGVGNPVINNLMSEMKRLKPKDKIDFVGFSYKFETLRELYIARKKKYDIIHFQFGGIYIYLALLPFVFQNNRRVVTFHGTEIHGVLVNQNKNKYRKFKVKLNRLFALFSFVMFSRIGFVSHVLIDSVPKYFKYLYNSKFFIQRLGVDYNLFKPIPKSYAREYLDLDSDKKLFLFSSISSSPVKRLDLAEKIVQYMGEGYQLLLMNAVPSDEVPFFMAATDYVLLTSDAEGSPNIVREALAMNRPVFGVNVGDVKDQISNCKESLIISVNPEIASGQIKQKLKNSHEENTRDRFKFKISLENTTRELISLYEKCIFK
ncbi:glycosyltransferase family protein [Labilibaculum antarcticum]|uniref:Glycosyl transferase family 1 domain-containing protein n=1 Tax=Labilibaculum antarcticum TaxID=1717717 RepID=A0A1Y1CEU4_9BACT|nr:hypothetical protein [Labilibaculum antarcticum]BAX78633.1 hypothetical protein ALGA_0238 [Labilibaculum antarcticum]